MDLTTRYVGMELKNPLVVGASPLSSTVSSIRRLEDAGATIATPDAYLIYRRLKQRLAGQWDRVAKRRFHYAGFQGFTIS